MSRYTIVDENGQRCSNSVAFVWQTLRELRQNLVYGGFDNFIANGKLKVALMFSEYELKEDIERAATVQGKSMQKRINKNNSRRSDGEDSVFAIANFQEVCEEENWPYSQRILALGVSEVEAALKTIAAHAIEMDRSMDNRKEDNIEYVIEMNVGEQFSSTFVEKLMRTIHDYLMARVLFEWAGLNYEEFAEFWLRKMEMDMVELKKIAQCSAMEDARLMPSWCPI